MIRHLDAQGRGRRRPRPRMLTDAAREALVIVAVSMAALAVFYFN